MSVVERAIRNLKGGAKGGESTGARQSIARVAAGQASEAPQGFGLAENSKDAPNFVEFNLESLRDAGLFPMGNQRLADEYRIIKRPLLKSALGENASDQRRPNLLMVSSALPGEGKTFTSVNLSMSLASEKDWDVLLVDVDCKNPQLSRLLGVAEQTGLLDLLRNPSLSLADIVLATNIERLYVVPLGRPGEDAAELLGSQRMSELCDSLSTGDRKQIVICDSSPLLLTTEPVVLSGQLGQVVVVVNAYKTAQQAVVQAVEKLDPEIAIGLILNRTDRNGGALGYGTYGGYGAYPAANG